MTFRRKHKAAIAAGVLALSVMLTGCGSSDDDVTSSAKVNGRDSALSGDEGPASQDRDSSSSAQLIGKWYCEKEDILFDMQSGGKLAVTEHGKSSEQTWKTASAVSIDGLLAGTPSGYDGIFVHYYDTGEPDHFAYRFENAETLIMAHMRAVSSEDLPDAPNDNIKVGSELTFYRQ